MKHNARITQTAKYLPDRVVTNDDLAEFMETSDEWIYSRTGIKQRYVVTTENTSDLCGNVALELLKKSNYSATDLDFIIVATMTPDYSTPSTACLVQAKIGATNALCFDVSAACSGFVYALATAEKIIKSGTYQKGLVIGGEAMSKMLDWSDRRTAVLFGDGAAGVLLEASDEPQYIGEYLQADGERGMSLTGGEMANDSQFFTEEHQVQRFLTMDGRKIFDFSLRNVSKNITDTVALHDLDLADIDFFLPHQANIKIIDAIAKRTKIPRDKFLSNIQYYGNTSAASVALLLHDSIENGTIALGSRKKVVLTGFGGGLTWGSILLSL